MAADGPKISEINAKILRLDTVFKKAIDVSSNSLNNADLDNCFMDLKSQFGNVLPKLYMNMIAKSQINIEVIFCTCLTTGCMKDFFFAIIYFMRILTFPRLFLH